MNTTRPYENEDLFRMRWLHSADLNSAGTHAVYALSEYDADSDVANLWLLDIERGDSHQLTYGNDINASPAWSPDGTTLAFLSNRTEKPQLFLLSTEIGEASQLTHLPNGVGGAPSWSPDGSYLAFIAGQQDDELEDPTKPYRVTLRLNRRLTRHPPRPKRCSA